jgi:2-hydroxycyclohexanecarboxyl-CoA dehydrogenase
MADRLKNKVSIITGGAGGIGSTAAQLFASEGGKVAIVDLDPAAVETALGRIRAEVPDAQIMGIVADLGVEQAATDVTNDVLARWGAIDVVVNNIGIRRYDAIEDADWSKWDDILRVNTLSYVSMTRAALPALRKSGQGSIINISSTGAVFGRKGMAAYDASKAAVLALTRVTAHEEAEHGIRANSICPGYTRTIFHLKRMGEEAVDALIPPCVMKRWADPIEMAYPILWLASSEASYVTGTTIMVDGGYIGP